ncbi:iron-sulfur cluster assembly scaffold protein [Dehalococcoidia bacterium]|nr:iron-sulfur cluster assembly scaffold protein [Dehalococcoidia bacterium]
MTWYNQKVLEHFKNPRNNGVMVRPDGEAMVSNPACGDTMRLYIKVSGGVIVDAKWQTRGCGSAIAASSVASELITGKSLNDCRQLTRTTIAESLGGLPQSKIHCSVLAADALRAAIGDYESKRIE